MKRSCHTKRLIDVIGLESFDNMVERGSEEDNKEYRIPIYNRYPQWPHHKCENLVDSVMKNYPIHTFITSEHIDSNNNSLYKHIEDGQTRLSVLQNYIKDKFTWNDKKYSELTPNEKATFNFYEIRIENLSKSSNMSSSEFIRELHIVFDRLNSGKPLTNNDKYHLNRQYAPCLLLIDEVKESYREHFKKYIGDVGEGKARTLLSEMVGMVLPLILNDGSSTECINTSYERNNSFIYKEIDESGRENVIEFLNFYFKLLDDSLSSVGRVKKVYGKLSGVFGLLIYSWVVDKEKTQREHYTIWKEFIINNLKKDYVDKLFSELRQGDRRNLSSSSLSIRRNIVLGLTDTA